MNGEYFTQRTYFPQKHKALSNESMSLDQEMINTEVKTRTSYFSKTHEQKVDLMLTWCISLEAN